MMGVPPPEPPGQVMTVEQQADLDCLTLARGLDGRPSPLFGKVDPERMTRVFSDRLRRSDSSRDWTSLAGDGSAVRFGWYLGHVDACAVRLNQPTAHPRLRPESVRASVWLDAHEAQWHATIEDAPKGYRFIVDCVRGCIPPMRYVQDIGDAPISLFRPWDGDDLVYSIWAGGSAYRVRVWKVSLGGVSQVLDASSRGRPDILSAADGTPVVRTYEAESGVGPRSPVAWEYRGGVFIKDPQESR